MATNTDREQQIELILHSALAHEEGQRDHFLKTACAGDPALRHEIEARLIAFLKANHNAVKLSKTESLLTPQERLRSENLTLLFADLPTIGLTDEEEASLFTETHIGAYKILRLLSENDLSIVYLAASDDSPYHHKVAITIGRSRMNFEFASERFYTEQQRLTSLDHANIARLLDSGITMDGRPYFVSEYVEGKSIITYCDDNRLSTIERLKLFRKVCAAAHHGHQHLVLHQDIKPDNILVTDSSTPKLLNFGIAKLLHTGFAEQSLDTQTTLVRLMTPEYASPEQVKGEAISTASNIYSLGVVLYQLLTGHLPYRLKDRLSNDLAKMLCEQQPERPSTAIDRVETVATPDGATIEVTPQTVSRARDRQLERLRKRLSGDVDNIVLMALRKEPGQRYASADELANDIRRHLEALPVIARPDTLSYRTRKFIRRHRIATLVSLLALAILVGGIVTTSIQKRRAERRFNEVRRFANAFLFEFHDAIAALPGSAPARQLVVNRALEYLDNLARETSNDESLQRELAMTYQKVGDAQGYAASGNLGDADGALQSFKKALAIRERLVTENPANQEDRRHLAISYSRVAAILEDSDAAAAIEFHKKAVVIAEALLAADENDAEMSRHLWLSYRHIADEKAQTGDFANAIETFDKAAKINEKLLAANPGDVNAKRDLALDVMSLGDVLTESRDYDAALEMFRKALALASANPNHSDSQSIIGLCLASIGKVFERKGNQQTASEHFEKSLAIFESLRQADPLNAQAIHNAAVSQSGMAGILAKSNRLPEALALYAKAEANFAKNAGAKTISAISKMHLAAAQQEMALLLARRGDLTAALQKATQARIAAEELPASKNEFRAFLASTYTNLSKIHALAAQQSLSVEQQRSEWQQAREWLLKGLEWLRELRNQDIWHSPDYGSVEESERELARYDAAIARLSKTVSRLYPLQKPY